MCHTTGAKEDLHVSVPPPEIHVFTLKGNKSLSRDKHETYKKKKLMT